MQASRNSALIIPLSFWPPFAFALKVHHCPVQWDGLRFGLPVPCSPMARCVSNTGFLGGWGTYACPQCLPSDTVPVRSWTWTLRPPDVRHRHLPCHAIGTFHMRTQPLTDTGAPSQTSTMPYHTMPYVHSKGTLSRGIVKCKFEQPHQCNNVGRHAEGPLIACWVASALQ